MADLVLQAHPVGTSAGSRFATEQGRGNLVVAIYTQGFLTQIRFAFHILPEVGNRHGQLVSVTLNIEEQLLQDALRIVCGNIHTGTACDLLAGSGDHLLLGRVGINVNHAADHIAGIQLIDHLAGTLHGLHGGLHGYALFEPTGGFRADAQCTAGDTGGCPVKHGTFEHHGMGLLGDFTFFAAHDTCNAGRLAGVTDD